ncbi:MAG: hypothetical protein AUJ85_10125 [Elusimicrobia bacterium CG1_02_37_114]|nr:MAG: hypothetical protein AUJ85_10125 [Elusimicrobia bacterium CG1_02_37_114]PIV52359.1 MAG: hypothetical protein COS17_09600 [Elusimicrobia bacterium CG02_land_8_20_14_3_00_37_13]PIZ13501.1 MAG: hypothetical protein COY53_04465 [Elusimicrobia bacterium CG_4_10_14_0_8_um_filter_37_32]
MKNTKINIEEIKKRTVPVLKKYKVRRASLFGSVVTGDTKKGSDIDLLVELPLTASLFDLAGLKLDLEEMLGKKVDVLTYNSLNPLLKNRILSEEKAIL